LIAAAKHPGAIAVIAPTKPGHPSLIHSPAGPACLFTARLRPSPPKSQSSTRTNVWPPCPWTARCRSCSPTRSLRSANGCQIGLGSPPKRQSRPGKGSRCGPASAGRWHLQASAPCTLPGRSKNVRDLAGELAPVEAASLSRASTTGMFGRVTRWVLRPAIQPGIATARRAGQACLVALNWLRVFEGGGIRP
jgi:hypothetical protein